MFYDQSINGYIRLCSLSNPIYNFRIFSFAQFNILDIYISFIVITTIPFGYLKETWIVIRGNALPGDWPNLLITIVLASIWSLKFSFVRSRKKDSTTPFFHVYHYLGVYLVEKAYGRNLSQFKLTIFHFCDDESAIKLTRNPVFHAHTKYIKTHFHFVWEKILTEDIRLYKIYILKSKLLIYLPVNSSLKNSKEHTWCCRSYVCTTKNVYN